MKTLQEILRRPARRALARLLFVVAAALLVVSPAWRGARVLAVVSALQGADDPGRAPPPGASEEEEEEAGERAALARSDIEILHAAARRDTRVAATGALLRHRMEEDVQIAASRWQSYRAPPRAPPRRLLN